MYDVAIIVQGSQAALSPTKLGKYNVKAVIVEKENDVSVGTTKANSAIIHGGYDPKPGTKMADTISKEMSIQKNYVRNWMYLTNRSEHW